MKQRARNETGSAINAFGPAWLIIFCLCFFPLMELFALTLTYLDCLYLTALLSKQASMETAVTLNTRTNPAILQLSQNPQDAEKLQTDLNSVVESWSEGFGQFASTSATPVFTTSVDLSEGKVSGGTAPPEAYIHVNLSCRRDGFLDMPLPCHLPGLNSPIEFQFSSTTALDSIPPAGVAEGTTICMGLKRHRQHSPVIKRTGAKVW